MSAHDKLIQAIHGIASAHAQRARTEFLADVIGLDPFTIEIHGRADTIDEDEGLTMTENVKYYDSTTGIVVGDLVMASRIDDVWIVKHVIPPSDVKIAKTVTGGTVNYA